jgi:glycerol-3-phosphate dehydrogenase
MLLSDALAVFRNVGRHRWLSKRSLLRTEPALREHGLKGGARYFDAQCDDARLTLANVRAAHQQGALVANYAQVDDLQRAGGRVRGAGVTDRVADIKRSVRAHVVVNATGPWSDHFRDDGRRRLQLSKGVHVMVPRNRISHTEAVTFTSPIDGRIIFIVPWGDRSYIGATSTDHDGSPGETPASADEVVYLLRSANAVFPDARLQPDDVAATWAGLRPLLANGKKDHPGSVCREFSILEHEGALSVLGGNLTTYRSMASKVVDRVAAMLHDLDGRTVPPRAPTDREALPGGQVQDLSVLMAEAEREGANPQLANHLVRTFGNEAPAVLRLAKSDTRLAEQIVPNHAAIRAELVHAIRREMAVTLGDLLMRRTHIFFEAKGKAVRQAADLVDLIGEEFEWNPQRKASELTAYLQEVDLNHQFRADAGETP